MLNKIAYQCDDTGRFVEETICQESPLEPGVWLCPGRATFTPPPQVPEGKRAVLNFQLDKWTLVDIPKEEILPQGDFSLLDAASKKLEVQTVAESLLKVCSQALDLMQWRELMGQPVDQKVKLEWFSYRKEIAAIAANPPQEEAWFVNLQTLELYPWPKQPEMPAEPA